MLPTPLLTSDWGSTIHARLLLDRLAARDFDVHVYCLEHLRHPSSALTFHDLALPLTHPVLVEDPVSDEALMQSAVLCATGLLDEHRRQAFDLVHAHYATFTALAAYLFHIIAGCPFVVSSFGRDVNVGARMDARYRRMAEATLAASHAIIVPSEAVGDIISELGPANHSKTHVVPMAVDDRCFTAAGRERQLRRELACNQDYVVVNVSSCFSIDKGIEVLLRAIGLLRRRGVRVALHILGEDDRTDRGRRHELDELSEKLGLSGAVHFRGRVRHDEVAQFLANADVVVDPRIVNSASSAVVEAFIVETVVVVSDVESNRELAGTAEAPCVFHRAGDSEDLAVRIHQALTDDALRATVLDSLRLWKRMPAGLKFNADSMCDRTIEVYERALLDLADRARA